VLFFFYIQAGKHILVEPKTIQEFLKGHMASF